MVADCFIGDRLCSLDRDREEVVFSPCAASEAMLPFRPGRSG